MTKVFRCVLCILPLLFFAPRSGLADTAFRLGVAPHTSARVIVEMYQPLRLHLEKALAMPVEIITAPDFTEFARRALAQDYDLAITTGHQARLLETDAQYAPLLTYQADFRAVALVAGNSPIKTVAALRGSKVLGLSQTSLVTLWGQHWLKSNGLGSVGMDYVSASDSVARLLLAGQASAGFTSLANYQQLAPAIQSQVRFLAISEPMAGRVYALNKRMHAVHDKIDSALWAFADSPEGKQYFEKFKLEGYRKLKPRELEKMEPYAVEVRQFLKSTPK
jgi:phosphonate transport system substrate-binding protein